MQPTAYTFTKAGETLGPGALLVQPGIYLVQRVRQFAESLNQVTRVTRFLFSFHDLQNVPVSRIRSSKV